jgi:hypothetical protein
MLHCHGAIWPKGHNLASSLGDGCRATRDRAGFVEVPPQVGTQARPDDVKLR